MIDPILAQPDAPDSWTKLVAQCPHWFIVLDGENRIAGVNPAAREALSKCGFSLSVGRSLSEAFPASSGLEQVLAWCEAARQGRASGGSISLMPKSFPGCVLSVWPLEGGDGQVAVHAIPPAEDNLDDSSSAELDRFAYFASHDLQEPLRMVTAYLQLLRKTLPAGTLEGQAGGFFDRALQGADRMKAMIYGLLEYARTSTRATERTMVHLAEPLQGARANLDLALRETSAEVVVEEPLPMVCADPHQLLQLLQNLIGNALKFRRAEETPKIHVRAQEERNYWRIEIADNGQGVPPEQRQRIFEIFQRLHSADEVPGSGIGLAVCRRIVQRHGGTLWVEPNEPQGSRFCATLRRTTAPLPSV